MNAPSTALAPLSRLLWKEYRAQRTLWLAMLGLGFLLQILIRIVFRNPVDVVSTIWVMAIVIPILSVIGSTAVLFAGEREEGTSDWLLRLSSPPGLILTAKWGFVLLASVGIAAFLSMSAMLLLEGVPRGDRTPSASPPSSELVLMALGFVVWGSFGSLVSRRVLTSIIAMAFWWIVTMIGPIHWIPWYLGYDSQSNAYHQLQETLTIYCLVAVGAADIWMGWRWCQGKYWDAQVLSDWKSRGSALLGRVLRQKARAARLPTGIEIPYTSQRVWQRLVWQERNRDSSPRLLLWGGGATAFIPALIGVGANSATTFLVLSSFALMATIPFWLGIVSFRHESEGQPALFLDNRGISPSVVWCAKHAVWLPRAFWIPLTIWAFGVLGEILSGLPSSLAHGQLPQSNIFLPPSLDANVLVTGLWFVLLTYGCGQLAAMLLRQVILSFVAGVVFSLLAFLWLALIMAMGVPTSWSVGGVVVWLFWMTWWYCPEWLSQRHSRWTSIRLGLNAIIPWGVMIAAIASWRLFEVHGFSPRSETEHFPDRLAAVVVAQYPHQVLVAELESEIARQSQPLTSADRAILAKLTAVSQGTNHWWELRDVGSGNGGPGKAAPEQQTTDRESKQQFLATNAERIKRILAATRQEKCVLKDVDGRHSADGPIESTWLTSPNQRMPQINVLECSADLLTAAGDLDQALDQYCAALRLANYWGARGALFARWSHASSTQASTLAAIVEWSNHSDQTVEKLQSAMERVQRELAGFPSVKEAAVAQYLMERKSLDQSIGERWSQSTSKDPAGSFESPFVMLRDVSRFIPWETARARRLLKQQLVELCRIDEVVQILGFGADIPRILDSPEGLSRSAGLLATTSLLKDRDGPSIEPTVEYMQAVLSRETIVRVTMVALALRTWKLQHGQWPESLDQLLEIPGHRPTRLALYSDGLIVDPWNGESFLYRGGQSNRLDPSTGQATMLCSVGPHRLHPIYRRYARPNARGEGSEVSAIVTNWRGFPVAFSSDDRCRVDLVDEKLVIRLPYTSQLPR